MRSGIHLQLLLGDPVPRPAPREIADAVDRVEVSSSDDEADAFQIVFKTGRGGAGGRLDRGLLGSRLLAPTSRVAILVRIGARPQALFDGIITHRQYVPGATAGAGLVAVTGDDLTALMDLDERIVSYPAMSDAAIATVLIGRYARYGVVPRVVPPAVVDQPLPVTRVPMQHGTDLDWLRSSAARVNHVFVLRAGPAPLTGVAYWGPAAGLGGRPLPALSVGVGGTADVTDARFLHDALAPQRVVGRVADPDTGRILPLAAGPPAVSALSRSPQSAARVALSGGSGGVGASVARGRAQALADASADNAVVAEGTVDTGRYGAVLQPHRLVGVRGAGRVFDGLYRVRRVTHVLERGGYVQRFRLGRPGTDTTTPAVPTAGGLEG
jgi:hypothetical protein